MRPLLLRCYGGRGGELVARSLALCRAAPGLHTNILRGSTWHHHVGVSDRNRGIFCGLHSQFIWRVVWFLKYLAHVGVSNRSWGTLDGHHSWNVYVLCGFSCTGTVMCMYNYIFTGGMALSSPLSYSHAHSTHIGWTLGCMYTERVQSCNGDNMSIV